MNPALLVAFALLAADSCPEEAESSIVAQILDIVGLPAAVEKGNDLPAHSGDVVVASPGNGSHIYLTRSGNYRSPIFSGKDHVIAIKNNDVVRLKIEGAGAGSSQESEFLAEVPGVERLVGFMRSDRNLLVVLTKEGNRRRARILCLSPHRLLDVKADLTNEAILKLGRLRGNTRQYQQSDGTELRVETVKGASGQLDVFIGAQNATDCADRAEPDQILECTQGAIEGDGIVAEKSRLVYIRTTRSKPAP